MRTNTCEYCSFWVEIPLVTGDIYHNGTCMYAVPFKTLVNTSCSLFQPKIKKKD